MRKFTPTEIDLCRKIAEKERRKVDIGDFFIDTFYKKKEFVACHTKLFTDDFVKEFGIPLWQEHDCLEWLREKGFIHLLIHQDRNQCLIRDGRFGKYITDKSGKTPLEALLRAVLAVMEETE